MLGKDDTDNLGCFVQYRIAFYVAGGQGLTRHPTISKLLRCCCRVVAVVLIWLSGSLENFFLFFDGYLQYKSKQFARATPFEVNVHPHMGVDLSGLKETLTYKPIEFLEPASALPLKWYEAHPVVGNRILCFHFEAEDDNILHLVITGNTWLYRDDLERHGIAGSRSGDGYFRFLKNIDVTSTEMCQRVLSLVDIFHKQNVRVICDPKPGEGSAVGKFLHDLASDVPQFHFA